MSKVRWDLETSHPLSTGIVGTKVRILPIRRSTVIDCSEVQAEGQELTRIEVALPEVAKSSAVLVGNDSIFGTFDLTRWNDSVCSHSSASYRTGQKNNEPCVVSGGMVVTSLVCSFAIRCRRHGVDESSRSKGESGQLVAIQLPGRV